jgi:hypothetical protein
MTIMDIIIKILLFFAVFYGAIAISAFVGKKIREKQEDEKEKKEEK